MFKFHNYEFFGGYIFQLNMRSFMRNHNNKCSFVAYVYKVSTLIDADSIRFVTQDGIDFNKFNGHDWNTDIFYCF